VIELPRRRFLTGLASLIAAPAIVRVASIMPVKAAKFEEWTTYFHTIGLHPPGSIVIWGKQTIYGFFPEYSTEGIRYFAEPVMSDAA
jgi:hypothetical protein